MGFWGDMLKILAHGGVQTGASILGQTVTAPILAQKSMDQEEFKTLLQAAGTAKPEAMSAISERLKELSGRGLPTYTRDVPTGALTTPEGETLAKGTYSLVRPESAGILAQQGFKPEVAPKEEFVRPKISVDQVLAGMLGNAAPDSPEMQDVMAKKLGVGLTQAEKIRLAQEDARENRFQQTQERLSKQFEQTQQFHEIMGQGLMDFRKAMLNNQIQNQKVTHQLVGNKIEAGARKQLDSALKDVIKILDTPGYKPEALDAALSKYNALHGSIVAKHPDLTTDFTPLELDKVPGMLRREIVKGVRPKQTTVPTNTTTPAITFPGRFKINGKVQVINSQEEYDRLVGK